MVWALLIVAAFVAITVFRLRGPNLSQFDAPLGQRFHGGPKGSEEHDAVVASLALHSGPIQRAPRKQRLSLMREYMDNMSEGLELAATITPADAGGVPAEWVVAPAVTAILPIAFPRLVAPQCWLSTTGSCQKTLECLV